MSKTLWLMVAVLVFVVVAGVFELRHRGGAGAAGSVPAATQTTAPEAQPEPAAAPARPAWNSERVG